MHHHNTAKDPPSFIRKKRKESPASAIISTQPNITWHTFSYVYKNLFHLNYGDLSVLLRKVFRGLSNYPVFFVAEVLSILSVRLSADDGETWFNTIRDAKLDRLNRGADVTKSWGWPRSRSSAWLEAMNSALTSALHPHVTEDECLSYSRWFHLHQVCFFLNSRNNLCSASFWHFYIEEIEQYCLF